MFCPSEQVAIWNPTDLGFPSSANCPAASLRLYLRLNTRLTQELRCHFFITAINKLPPTYWLKAAQIYPLTVSGEVQKEQVPLAAPGTIFRFLEATFLHLRSQHHRLSGTAGESSPFLRRQGLDWATEPTQGTPRPPIPPLNLQSPFGHLEQVFRGSGISTGGLWGRPPSLSNPSLQNSYKY